MINHLRRQAGSLLLLTLLLQACAGAGTEQQSEPTMLRVGILPYLAYADFFIGEEEGYFAEQGLQVEFVRLTPRDVIPAVAKAEVDVAAHLVTAGLLNAIGRSGEIKMVADFGHIDPAGCSSFGLVASQSLAETGELESPDRMKGKQVDVLVASWNHYYLDSLLATVGLTSENLVLTDIPSAAEGEALAKGTLDMAVTSEPWLTRLRQAGHQPILAPVQEVLPDSQTAVLIYGPRLLHEDPDAGERFMIAYLKAERQYNEGKTERNLEHAAQLTELDQSLLREACWPAKRQDGTIDVESVLRFQDWALDKGFLDRAVSEQQFWDPSFVEYANEMLGASSQ